MDNHLWAIIFGQSLLSDVIIYGQSFLDNHCCPRGAIDALLFKNARFHLIKLLTKPSFPGMLAFT